MFPLAEEAMKTLANFRSTVMAASKGGHDDGIGGNIRVIKFRDDRARSERR